MGLLFGRYERGSLAPRQLGLVRGLAVLEL